MTASRQGKESPAGPENAQGEAQIVSVYSRNVLSRLYFWLAYAKLALKHPDQLNADEIELEFRPKEGKSANRLALLVPQLFEGLEWTIDDPLTWDRAGFDSWIQKMLTKTKISLIAQEWLKVEGPLKEHFSDESWADGAAKMENLHGAWKSLSGHSVNAWLLAGVPLPEDLARAIHEDLAPSCSPGKVRGLTKLLEGLYTELEKKGDEMGGLWAEMARKYPVNGFLGTDDMSAGAAEETVQDGSKKKSTVSDETKDQVVLLSQFHNLVLEGVPGTGKTYAFKKIVEAMKEEAEKKTPGSGRKVGETRSVTLHPSTSYEDFIEGLRPLSAGAVEKNESASPWFIKDDEDADSSSKGWGVRPGFFVRACRTAALDPEEDHLVLLDELNRANIPRVLGDLITTLESSKRARWKKGGEADKDKQHVTLPGRKNDGYWDLEDTQPVTLQYSRRRFFVPDNLYVVATMNTTDRSVAPLDAAMRRRFAFSRLEPMDSDKLKKELGKVPEFLATMVDLWHELNNCLKEKIGPDAMLGHSYFFDQARRLKGKEDDEKSKAVIQNFWKQQILPQLIDAVVSANKLELLKDAGKDEEGSLGSILGTLSEKLHLTVEVSGEGLFALPTVEESTAKEGTEDNTPENS